jgi:hypothetical protein
VANLALRMSISLIFLAILPLPWIWPDPGLLVVDLLGLGASLVLLLLAVLKLRYVP